MPNFVEIARHRRVPRPRFPIRRGNFDHCAINKGYIAYFYCACVKRPCFRFRFEDVFSRFFSSEKQTVRHISTSGLFGLLSCKACHVLSHPRWSFSSRLKLIRLSIAELQRCWCGYVTWPCDLDLWPYKLVQWSNMAGHVGNLSTMFEDPMLIRSWLMSYDVHHRPPLTMRLELLRMRRITWHERRGQIFLKYLKSLTPICLFTMQPPRLYNRDKLSYLICQNSARPCMYVCMYVCMYGNLCSRNSLQPRLSRRRYDQS